MTDEISLAFGADAGLVGTLTRPADGATLPVGLILYNAGFVHRIGPRRLHVKLARRLALEGAATLRFDLRGLGDSPASTAQRHYLEQAVTDLVEAMDQLQVSAGVERFAILGFCSGVESSMATALRDPRVAGVFLYDGVSFPTWRSRLLSHGLRLRKYGLLGSLRLLLSHGLPRDPADTPKPERRAVAAALDALVARGVAVTVAFSGGSFDVVNHASQFRSALAGTGLSHEIQHVFLADVDHVATSPAAQQAFLEAAQAWFRRVARSPMRVVPVKREGEG